MTDHYLTKSQLRKKMKCMLNALTNLEKQLESQQMVEKISHYIQASPQIQTIASYAAMPTELNLDALHSSIPEVSFCYPKCDARGVMEFYTVTDLSTMRTSEHGIREPDGAIHERVEAESIDLFLCPAYAYTTDGKRLGKGGGFYDRYLLKKRTDATTLGVIFTCQIVDYILTEDHDLLIDQVL